MVIQAEKDEQTLEDNYKNSWRSDGNFRAAVVFTDGLQELRAPGSSKGALPYKIRMNPFQWSDDLQVRTNTLRFPSPRKLLPRRGDRESRNKADYLISPAGSQADDVTRIGPNKDNERRYIDSGFIGLQLSIDKALVKQLTLKDPTPSISLQPFPYPSFETKSKTRVFILISIASAYGEGLYYILLSMAGNVVGEKQTGISELLRSIGISRTVQWLGWLIHFLTPQLFVIIVVTVLAYVPIIYPIAALQLEYTDPFLFWVILVLYVCASLAFGFFICSLCRQATIAAVIVALISHLCGTVVKVAAESFTRLRRVTYILSIFPHVAFGMLLRNIGVAVSSVSDESDKGFASNWSTLGRRVEAPNGNGMTNLELLLMLLADILLYMGLSLYFDSVLPSKFGVKRPWYLFTCRKEKRPVVTLPTPSSTSVLGLGNSSGSGMAESDPQGTPTSFEADPSGARVVVDVRNLQKRLGKGKVTVDGVTLRMYEGDIFTLLGHNGAGKTTLISILTGFQTPSGGTAFIDGVDIAHDLEMARDKMGYCSQHNMLFENLRAVEQLTFFGMIRGMSYAKADEEANFLLEKMGMLDKASFLVKKLSEGQKRKLSLGLALIGGTKVVILDEPTSDMDSHARRDIWDFLLKIRGERTILLATHSMEEADVIGDRIGIMAGGKLQCCGSPAYLKKFYGTGYTLKLTLNGGAGKAEDFSNVDSEIMDSLSPSVSLIGSVNVHNPAVQSILELVRKHIPDASLKSEGRVDRDVTEVFFMLPDETATTTALCKMFDELMKEKGQLGIYTVGLSQSTMDEVFVRVGTLADGEENWNETTKENASIPKKPQKPTETPIVGQLSALLVKKFIYSARKRALHLFLALIPLVLFMIIVSASVFFSRPRSPTSQKQVAEKPSEKIEPTDFPLAISLDAYQSPVTFYSDSSINPMSLAAVIGPSAHETTLVSTELLKIGRKDRVKYKRNHIVAAKVTSSEFIAMFNLHPYHAAPLAINIATNAVLKYVDPNDNHRIFVTNHPFYDQLDPNAQQSLRQSLIQNPGRMTNTIEKEPEFLNSILSIILPTGFVMFLASFVVMPIEERLCKLKQLQTMTGVNPVVYWGASFLWDYWIYFVVVLLMLIYLLIVDLGLGYGLMTGHVGWLVLVGILMLYGIPAIFLSYLHSFRANTVLGGFIFLIIFHHLAVFVHVVVYNAESLTVLEPVCRLHPTCSLIGALRSYAAAAQVYNNCPIIIGFGCVPENYGVWQWTWNNPLENKERPALGQHIFWLFITGIFYAGIILLIEFRTIPALKICPDEKNFEVETTDQDVLDEMERVDSLVANGKVESDALVVENLCKSFRHFPAVSCLHFGVHHGECFGLLGEQGAGKTTVFRMITGDLKPTVGNVYGFGTSLDKNWREFLSNIGYCPQVDAILPKFTGKEMLELFAGLRGVPYKSRGNEAMRWLTRVKLEDSANVKCGQYSGGMKRRLSTAMAMIGDPALVLLDEPTSGVNPMARRRFWKILDNLRESGQSIILTSHSMEECEQLCSRLGIMVNGQFRCFGGVQYLKTRFAQGYSLTVKLKLNPDSSSPNFEEEIARFEEGINTQFEPCVLKDKHQNHLQYRLLNPSITWDILFKMLEEIKAEFPDLVEDYSVNETSLEDVFIEIAKEQNLRELQKKSIYRQICTCSC